MWRHISSANSSPYSVPLEADFHLAGVSCARGWRAGRSGGRSLGEGTPNTLLQDTGEGNGIVELAGTFSSITFVHTAPEFWAGFTIGIQDVVPVSGVPEPGTALLLGCGMAVVLIRRKLMRRA